MDDMMIEDRLENIDRRVTRIEQILPTLATKDDLRAFATLDDLRRLEERLTAQMRMLYEKHESVTRLLAEHLTAVMTKLGER